MIGDANKKCVQWLGHNLEEVIAFTGWHPSAREKYTWEEYKEWVEIDGLKIFNKKGNERVQFGDYIFDMDGDFRVLRLTIEIVL